MVNKEQCRIIPGLAYLLTKQFGTPMRTPRSKIRHLIYKKYENVTVMYSRPSTWKEATVKETLVKKAIGTGSLLSVLVLIFCISLLIISVVLLFVF